MDDNPISNDAPTIHASATSLCFAAAGNETRISGVAMQ
jgi:hypothetical protein